MEQTELPAPLIWDDALVAVLPGKLVLVGLNYLDVDGELVEQQQYVGRVHSMAQHNGIVLTLEGSRHGAMLTVPPDMRAFLVASPGQYRLRSTGEVVVDPDFTATFSIRRKADDDSVEDA